RGGNCKSVVYALISANKSNLELTYELAARLDLEGYDLQQIITLATHENWNDLSSEGWEKFRGKYYST
ncbi:MAG: hypothetical protein AAF740_15105, partial [Bacteroidota bacterium]